MAVDQNDEGSVAPRLRQEQLAGLISSVSVPGFLLLWELISRSGIINGVLFPPPSTVARSILHWASSGQLLIDFLASLQRVVVGYIAGAVLGTVIGVLTGRYSLISAALSPIFQLLRPIPPIAFVPIVILWFGLGELGKYFVVFWGVFFTVWMSAHLGVQQVDERLIRAARSLGTPESRLLHEVLVPGAMPYIIVGLRTSVTIAFYTLVAAELAGTFAGLVYRIDIAQQNLQMGQMLGGLVILGVISATADKLFSVASRKLIWW